MSSKSLDEPKAPPLPRGLLNLQSIRQRLFWLGEAAVLAVFWQICALLPLDRAAALGRAVARRLGPRHHKQIRMRRNMMLAFPGKSQEEIDKMVCCIWSNFGQVMAEIPHLETICWREAKERIEIVLKDESAVRRWREKPAIFVTAHLGNWELSAATPVAMGIPMAVVYGPMKNPLVDRMLQRYRRALRCGLVTKTAGARELVRHLADGRSLGLVVDQRVDSGEMVPFFGRPSYTTVTPARLALRFGLDLVPSRVERLPGSRFRVTLYEPLRPRDETQSVREQSLDMTAQLNAQFETWIRERPHEWYCGKRRWPRNAQLDPPPEATRQPCSQTQSASPRG